MSVPRRFTRSTVSSVQSSNETETTNKNDVQMRIKVHEALVGKDYEGVLKLLNSSSVSSHWAACARAQALFQLRKTTRALSTVRDSLNIKQKDCHSCYELLLNIIVKGNLKLQNFKEDIENCLKAESLPTELREEFERLKSELVVDDFPREPTNREFKELTSYYESKGLTFKKVEIVEISAEYRVARAKETIKPNEPIIFVPEKEMITLEQARSAPELQKLARSESKLKSPKHTLLSIFLSMHKAKGKMSPYYNYIRCLPRNLETFPIYYKASLLEELKGTSFLTLLERKKREILEDFTTVSQIVPELGSEIINEATFLWARMIVSSRIFGVYINGRKTDALVPIADMLNHRTPKITTWFFSDERKGFIVQNTNVEIQKGHEIFDSYGSKCNSRFLLNYGFTVEDNGANEVMVNLKRVKGAKPGLTAPSVKLTQCSKSDEFRLVLSYYRAALSKGSSKTWDSPSSELIFHLQNPTNFISNENELQVWQMIEQTMKDQLSTYPTTIRNDERILKNWEGLDINYLNCVRIRLGEKNILNSYLTIAKKTVNLFERNLKSGNAELAQYLREFDQVSEESSQ